jgi:phage shock protein A
MQARAGAIDELIASGALDDASQLNAGDDISRELDALSSGVDVETELARLKAVSGGSAQRQAIESGAGEDVLSSDERQIQREINEGGPA